MKKIKLTESQLQRIIKRCVNETFGDPYDEKYKQAQIEHSWERNDYENRNFEHDGEKTCYNSKLNKPVTDDGRINVHGIARDENLNVHDLKGQPAMHSLSDNARVSKRGKAFRDTLVKSQNAENNVEESIIRRVVKKLVNETLDDMESDGNESLGGTPTIDDVKACGYFVIARDTCFSGWGRAEGRKSYMVIGCQDQSIWDNVYYWFNQRSEMKNVRQTRYIPRLNGRVDYFMGRPDGRADLAE